jgi:myo-inositol-1(or 4)-monophosphatase
LGSAAIDLAYVACGRLDGFWEWGLNPWDAAAGWLLIEEAGGKLTKTDGSAFELAKPDMLATNALLHEQMIVVLNEVKPQMN